MANFARKDSCKRFNERKIGIDSENVYVAGLIVKQSSIMQVDVEKISTMKLSILAIFVLAVLGVTMLITNFLPRALQVVLSIVCFSVMVLIMFDVLAKKGKFALILQISSGSKYMFASDNCEILEKTANKIRQMPSDNSSIGDEVYIADFSNGIIGKEAIDNLWK